MTLPNERAQLGAKVRSLRRREGLSQALLASRLGISPSYLNLIEANRRPLPAALLIKLAQEFRVELHTFATDSDARLLANLMEVFADGLFEGHGLTSTDVREMASSSPAAARAVLTLYRSYKTASEATESLASRVGENESQLPSEEVSDFIQQRMNHFPALEEAAEEVCKKARLGPDELYPGLVRHLEKAHGISVRVARWDAARGAMRRFDPIRKELVLSELLPTRSRIFHLAHQLALVSLSPALDALIGSDAHLTSAASRALARVALASYFAGAVVMPYAPFLQAAREERYDVDVIGRRFRVGFEQVCHRFTTLRRPGAEGVPFHMIRIDVAGNISKRFSASGIRFARYSGACPRWNIFQAFMTPGMIRIQLSKMPDGATYFCIARTLHKDSGGYHAQQPVQAIGLGCQLAQAKELVYSDGVDLESAEVTTPVGVTCRVCERTDCEQRAFPSLRHPLQVDENVRGVSLYAPADPL